MQSYKELLEDISKEFPDFKIVKKPDSRFMKFLDVLLRVVTFNQMKLFMRFITTIRHTVYVCADWDTFVDNAKVEVLRHERVHMRQADRLTFPLFIFLYLLFPLPMLLSWYRAKFEMEAYAESMLTIARQYGIKELEDTAYRESMIAHFTGPAYGWMWVKTSTVSDWYYRTLVDIRLQLVAENTPP